MNLTSRIFSRVCRLLRKSIPTEKLCQIIQFLRDFNYHYPAPCGSTLASFPPLFLLSSDNLIGKTCCWCKKLFFFFNFLFFVPFYQNIKTITLDFNCHLSWCFQALVYILHFVANYWQIICQAGHTCVQRFFAKERVQMLQMLHRTVSQIIGRGRTTKT